MHCKMGVSRSSSTVIAYAMKQQRWPLDVAMAYVRDRRSIVKPNDGFMKQLQTYNGILNARSEMSPHFQVTYCRARCPQSLFTV